MYLEDDAENVPKLSEVLVKKKKDLIVDNLTLTVKKDDIFVLIEDNGWGKSAILQNIAGLTDVDSGMATAFVIYLLNSLRFITDNLLSLSSKCGIDWKYDNSRAHHIFCKFMGIEDIES